MAVLPNTGTLSVVPPAQLELQLAQQAKDKAATATNALPAQNTDALCGFVKGQFEIFRNHRNTVSGWSERMLTALRSFNGQYDSTKIQEIKKWGGSQVFARLIAQKCRGASSLLRDVYLGPDQSWGLRPPADPDVPPEVTQQIEQLLQVETQMMAQGGQPAKPSDIKERKLQLTEAAREAASKRAKDQADIAEDKIEEMLREGSFYDALAAFLVDLPIFPFSCIKGPVVKIIPTVTWPVGGGPPQIEQKPKLYWYRVSPFDLWWTPGVSDVENAAVIEKLRFTRGELNDMLTLPGYNVEAIHDILQNYGRGGLYDNWDTTDAERAVLESKENPAWNRSQLITGMEYNGNVQGVMLQDYGIAVPDAVTDYHCQIWCIGPRVIKAQISPSPRQRHPYFITSFEKVPGTVIGNGLTDILSDLQDVANATLRALVNNLSISSGPQVVVNDDRLAPDEAGEDIFPWKRWHVITDPTSNAGQQPISFFQPQSNAQELLAVYKAFSEIADDISAIPKYLTSGSASGGAGRTASGLAMLMGNASKLLQTVSANIDRDVLEPALLQLFDLILLTDTTGLLTGEERVTVQGVNVAIQRETQRQRQIEFLASTNNPTDMQIVGLKGRAAMLRAVSTQIGLPGEGVVPSEIDIEKMQQQQEQQKASKPAEQAVEKGVQQGIEQATKAITSMVIEQQLPPQIQAGAQEGAMPAPGGGPSGPSGGPPGAPGAPPAPGPGGAMMPGSAGTTGPAGASAQAQGNQPPKPSQGMGPHTALMGQPKQGNMRPMAGPQ